MVPTRLLLLMQFASARDNTKPVIPGGRWVPSLSQYQNAPANIQSVGDVSIRPIYAEWADADIYVSVHSNASGLSESTAAGTQATATIVAYLAIIVQTRTSVCDDPVEVIVYNAWFMMPWLHPLERTGIRIGVIAERRSANFGELRNLDDMPGVLLETAFHDNVRQSQSSDLKMTDNQALHDPRFRETLAYGISGNKPVLWRIRALPSPRSGHHLRKKSRSGKIEVHFNSVPGALGYRIYSACGHRDYDQGVITETSPATIPQLKNDEVCTFKIASLNQAGEGHVVRAITARNSLRKAQLLLVDSYERRDAWVEFIDNPGNTLATHGRALRETDFAFDSASESAVRGGLIDLSDYDRLVFAGRGVR